MLGAMSVVPMLDVIAKILSESYPVMQIAWARFAFHTLWLLPLLYWKKLRWWQMPKQPGFHLLRSLMLALATLFFFTAIKTNPIPNALTLLFVSPLIVAMLAPFVLGERFDVFIGIGVLVGFVGVVVVLSLSRALSGRYIPFHSISFHFILFHSISFYFIPFHSISLFHFILFHFISSPVHSMSSCCCCCCCCFELLLLLLLYF